MSCGCGGKLPNSIVLRLEAARIAASSLANGNAEGFTKAVDAVNAYLFKDVEVDALDGPCKHEGGSAKGDDANAVFMRNSFLNAPLAAMLTIREGTIEALDAHGAGIIGSLVQAPRAFLQQAGLSAEQEGNVLAELEARGLSMGLTVDQVREWIKTGDCNGQGQSKQA